MAGSGPTSPLLLPQPQKSPHPLFLYHPFFHISIHLSSSLSHHRSKSESVFTQSRFSRVSPSRDSVLDEIQVVAHARDQDEVYIWNMSDAAALSYTSASSQKFKQKRNELDIKKGTGLEGPSCRFQSFTWLWTWKLSGPPGQNSTRRLFESWSVSFSAVWKEKKNKKRIVGMESKEHYESLLKLWVISKTLPSKH